MNKREISLGIGLVFLGVLFLLYNLGLINVNMILFILAVGLLIAYFLRLKTVYLLSGLVLLSISVIHLLDDYAFPNINIKGFLLLSILAIVGLVLFARQKNRLFLIASLILGSFAGYSLVREVVIGNVFWSLFFLFGISFIIYYLVDYRELGIVWPKHLGIGFCIFALVVFIVTRMRVKLTFWELLNFVWPLALIAIGIRIIYNMKKRNY